MGRLPKVAIVGRPNVGKSAIFNRICKKRIAIVDEAEGITRDRLYARAECFGKDFEVIDTGGINAKSEALFNEEIRQQAEIAIEEADSIILVVDSQIGILGLDHEVAQILRNSNKPVCLAVNKIDSRTQENLKYEFCSLGIDNIIAVSASHGLNIAELLEAALEPITNFEEVEEDNRIKIAIVGRTNVGKSTLINTLLDESRCIVSPIAGTTRDSLDIKFDFDGVEYTMIDTAGIRRKNSEHEVVDKFAFMRTERSIERADICLLMLDSDQGLTAQDKKIANLIEEQGKGCILLFNKWDLVKGVRMEHCLKAVRDDAHFLNHCPSMFISAETGRNLDKIFSLITEVKKYSETRITTGQLNKFIENCLHTLHPPMIRGKRLRIYYMTQVSNTPPTFIMFINYPDLLCSSYEKFLYNKMRAEYKFTGMPVRFFQKSKRNQETLVSRLDSLAAKKKSQVQA